MISNNFVSLLDQVPSSCLQKSDGIILCTYFDGLPISSQGSAIKILFVSY